MTIKCNKCELEKSVSEFYKSKRHKLGYIPTCKNCESLRYTKKYDPEKRRQHYIENRETYILRSKMYNELNKEKIKIKTKEYYNNNKLLFLEAGWKKKGILNKNSEFFRKLDFDELFEKANNCCQICGDSQTSHKKGFVVDHCHKTGYARGILCAYCNLSLGGFKDSIEILEAALKYLRNDESRSSKDGCQVTQ